MKSYGEGERMIMLGRTRFFSGTPANTEKKRLVGSEYKFIHVGGALFSAFATAFIDFFKGSSRVHDSVLKKILERFYTCFPKYMTHQPYLTPAERMSILLNNPRKSEIVGCMAYVLRQLTIDELYAEPLKYKEAFDGCDENTSQNMMRQSDVSLPVNAVSKAISWLLNLPVTLYFVESGKELGHREVYLGQPNNKIKDGLLIQVQQNNYFPGVKHEDDFAYVGQLAIKPLMPIDDQDHAGSLAKYIELIEEDNRRILSVYTKCRHNLLAMFQYDGLTKAKLIDLYIHFLPMNTNSRALDGMEQLFDEKARPLAIHTALNANQMSELLADSLAKWVSTGLIDYDELFERIEKSVGQTRTPTA